MELKTHYPDLVIPFRHQERDGYVVVSYGVNDDPVKAGFDSITGLYFDINLSRGYPVMNTRIETYEGSGYRTFLGWIQVVTRNEYDSYEGGTEPVEQSKSVDVPPSLNNLRIPFAAYGNLTQFFDAPCLNLYRHARLEWVADTFLTSFPGRSRNEEIAWLLGFRWGYIEYNTIEKKPVIILVEATGKEVWNNHISFLSSQFPDWRFSRARSFSE